MFDEMLDLATTRHIEDTLYQVVYTEPLEPYERYVGSGMFGTSTGLDAAGLRAELLRLDLAIEYANDTVVVEQQDRAEPVTFYREGGIAWNGVRAGFLPMRTTFREILSFDAGGMALPRAHMRTIQEKLKPTSTPADHVDELCLKGVDSVGDDGGIEHAFAMPKDWYAIGGVKKALAPWHGHAAEAFSGVYVDMLPSILTGQMTTAMLLAEALEITERAFTGLRSESIRAVADAVDILAGHPGYARRGPDFNWTQTLNIIAGIAGAVSGSSALLPVGGTVVAVVGAVISGGATVLAATVDADPGLVEARRMENQIDLNGRSAQEVMEKLDRTFAAFRAAVLRTEEVLRDKLAWFQGWASDKNAPGVTLALTVGKSDLEISRYNAFFAPKPPAIVAIDSTTDFDTITDDAYMGPAPSEGDYLAIELQGVLKAGNKWIPDLADNFSGAVDRNAAHGLGQAFSRVTYEIDPSAHTVETGTTTGTLYPQWMALYDFLMTVLEDTSDNLSNAGDSLIVVANAYADADAEARDQLAKDSPYY